MMSSGSYGSNVGRPAQGLIGGVGMAAVNEVERPFKVTVLGAAGGIGQTLSLLLKVYLPAGSKLSLYDLANVPGVAADISHVDTQVPVEWYQPSKRGDTDELEKALEGCDVCVIVAGVPRKPGMTRDDLFNVNAGVIKSLTESVAKVAPNCLLCIGTNPVNSCIPIAAEVLKAAGKYDKNKLLGVTLLDNMRACTFVNELVQPNIVVKEVPVIGGHSATTIVPLYSLTAAVTRLSAAEMAKLRHRVQNAGTEVVEAKAGKGSATLSMGAATAYFAIACVEALMGRRKPSVCAMVDTDGAGRAPYMAWPVQLGREGVETRLTIGRVSDAEKTLLDSAIPILIKDAEKGITWFQKQAKL
ncbi:malate dehydrogenase [Diplonema papillatum]|nr:malate dehydrogenase [Diplonema papillatum]